MSDIIIAGVLIGTLIGVAALFLWRPLRDHWRVRCALTTQIHKERQQLKEAWDAFHFPAGMNYSTCSDALNFESMSLHAVVAACEGLPEPLTRSVVITTREGFKVLVDHLPPKPQTPRSVGFSREPFFGVPVRKYADEGMARAAAIVAEADGFEVMLFLPESRVWELRDNKGTDGKNADEVDSRDEAKFHRAD